MPAVLTYRQDQENPPVKLNWLDGTGATIDFSSGYTFELNLVNISTGVTALTKTAGFTGAATLPNLTIAWTASQLALTVGMYRAHIRARHTASGLDRYFRPGDELQIQILAATTAIVPADDSGSELQDHLDDPTDAHDASAISFTPNGSIAATNVQAAIQEVRDEASGIGSLALDDLSDVTITAGASGDILRHNGTAWVDAVGTAHFQAAGAAAGGVLAGTYPNPSFAADMATQAELDAVSATIPSNAAIDERARDAVGTALVAGEGIDITVNDAADTITVDAELASETNPGVVELATSAETETGTDDTRATHPAGVAARYVKKSLFDANTILTADSDNTPQALTVAEQRLVGRITAGVITALTAAQVRTLINVEDGATADQTAAEILTALLTVDGAGSGLDADLLDGVSSAGFVQTSRTISTTAPVTGGGDLSANRTIAVDAATTSASGVVELATSAETITGTDTVRAVTPAGAAAAYQPLDSDLTTIAGLTATTDNFMVANSSAWASRTPTQARTHMGLGSMATETATDYVAKALYDANTILAATSDNTPAALTVAASRVVGRKASGDIAAMTAAETKTLLAIEEVLIIPIGDETTALTTGTAKVTFRMPFAMTVSAVRASLTTASSSGLPTFDINDGGTTILSTKLTIDANEKTSTTAATAAVISDTALADDAEITIDIDTAGTGAAGAKIYLVGTRA